MISNGGGTFSNTATGGTTTTPSGQNNDQDTSSPLLIDYLKVRSYLYKFTPYIEYEGSGAQQLPPSTTSLISASQNLSSQAFFLLGTLRAINSNVGALIFQGIPTTAGFFDTNIPTTVSAAIASISSFLNLPTVKAGKIVVTDPSRDASGSTSSSTSASSTVDISFLNIADVTALQSFLQQTADAGTVAAAAGYQQELLSALGTAINNVMVIASQQQATTGELSSSASTLSTALQQFQVSRFIYDLNVADLSRFDMSRYIIQYTVDQDLGNLSSAGSLSASVTLQNDIVSFQDLSPAPGPTAVRRPIFFPDADGDYAGYINNIPISASAMASDNAIPTLDPESVEPISTLLAGDLASRIAQLQTLEDNGGPTLPSFFLSGYGDAYSADCAKTEIAMRLRGIKDPRKKTLILEYFSTGAATDELARIVSLIGAQPSLSTMVATASLQTGSAPLGVSSSLTASQQAIKNQLTAKPGQTDVQLQQLQTLLTDSKQDGLLLSDLIQKHDFLSLFVYRHEIAPEYIESKIEQSTLDPFFFDKESLFLATPVTFLSGQPDNRKFATYASEFNGFVLDIASSETPGAVNTVTINLMGSMGLMSATKRIYNSTIYQGSVFDAAEVNAATNGFFSLYQNLFQGKDPLQILTLLLDSLYLLRVQIPVPHQKITLSSLAANPVTAAELNDIAVQQSTIGAANGSSAAAITAATLAAQQQYLQQQQTTTLGGTILRDATNNIASFLDILSMRAFNQFGETDPTSSTGQLAGPWSLFNMPEFLYANVMRQRRFNVRVATSTEVEKLGVEYGGSNETSDTPPFGFNSVTGQVAGAFNPFNATAGTLTSIPKEADGSGGSVLEINPFLDISNTSNNQTQASAWKAYYIYLSASLSNFISDLKTPFEIMSDVISSCYLELFETPGGRFVYRTPQYNNYVPIYRLQSQDNSATASTQVSLTTGANGTAVAASTVPINAAGAFMITSDDIIIISSSYSQTLKGLVSKQPVAYGADLISAPIIPQLQYFYSNGKIVSQYGLSMATTVVNPNVRAIPRYSLTSGTTDSSSLYNGIFHYCRFFLEYQNMGKFTATITAIADPAIQVGRTFFDTKNQKFGYITHVTKSLMVGSTYTCSFTLTAVRDAVYGQVIANGATTTSQQPLASPTFRRLPEMEDFVSQFHDTPVVYNGGAGVPNIAPFQATSSSGATPTDDFSVVSSEALANAPGAPGVPPATTAQTPVTINTLSTFNP